MRRKLSKIPNYIGLALFALFALIPDNDTSFNFLVSILYTQLFQALFAALLLQAPSFALYAAVIVDYTDEVVSFADAAKAQSLVYSTTTLGSVLASIVSGRLFDVMGVRKTMLIACAVCAVGTTVTWFGLERKNASS